MIILAEDYLFKIGNFEVTIVMLILCILAILMLVAIIAYRYNHRKQTKAAMLMDNECLIYNNKGLAKFIERKGKKFTNPTIVVVEIKNLSYLYINYPKRSKLLYSIADNMAKGLTKLEVISRTEFEKFTIIFDNRSHDEVKEFCQKIDTNLDTMPIEDYGKYDFYINYGIYENAPLQEPGVIQIASAITSFSKVIDATRYYYCQEVSTALEKIKKMNSDKDMDFENNRFVPYIQPKVDLRDGRVVGGEILCRWIDDSNRFKFEPTEFIPFFETVGFVKKIDELMLRAACEMARQMVSHGRNDIVISVNLSKIQFLTPNVDARVMDIVREYQVNPKNIEIEIAESTLMENYLYVSTCITKLRQLGFNVAMDDFGKSQSAMQVLSTNPLDIVKLDILFFNNRLTTDKDKLIVKDTLDMLSKLEYKKVCIGVSDRQTLEALAAISRDVIVQGYCFSQPIPLPQFEAFAGTQFDLSTLPEPAKEIVVEEDLSSDGKTGKDGVEAVVTQTPNGGTSINISGLGGTTVVPERDREMEELRRQMEEMRRQNERQSEEILRRIEADKKNAQEEELRRMREQMERLQNQPKIIEKKDTSEIDALRLEIERLKNQKNPNSSEIDALRLEIERMKLQNNTQHSTTYIQRDYRDRDYYNYRDDEVSRLRREVDDLRYSTRDSRLYDRYQVHTTTNRDREYELLQKQIDDLKENQRKQPVFNVDELIEKLSKTQNNSRYELEKARAEAKTLRERLEHERKEREELESLIDELESAQAQEENEEVTVIDEKVQEQEQEEADKNLNLDLSTLSRTDSADEDDDDDDDEEKLVKPTLSLEELEAIIQSYRDKYNDEWNQHAKDELQDGYWEIIDGLNYYKHTRQTFVEKMKKASPEIKQLYNIVKNELMKYTGVSNRLTNFYDCFYLGRKQIAKLSLTSKKLKVYLAANPANYDERHFPHRDVSEKKAHARTPYYALLKSQLSVRRINKVIADVMEESKSTENPSYKPVDYATKLKYYKKD